MSMLKHRIPAAFAEHGPLSNEGLRKVLPGASRSGVHRLLQDLKNDKKIYVSGYFKSNGKIGGACVPIYALGNLPDVAKPLTRDEQRVIRKIEALTRPEKVKYESKNIGRPMILRTPMKPLIKSESSRTKPQPAGIWSGLMT